MLVMLGHFAKIQELADVEARARHLQCLILASQHEIEEHQRIYTIRVGERRKLVDRIEELKKEIEPTVTADTIE